MLEKSWHESSVARDCGDQTSGGGPGRAALREAKGATGDSHVGDIMSEVQGDAVPACVADHHKDGLATMSEIHEGITLIERRGMTGSRKLFVLASIVGDGGFARSVHSLARSESCTVGETKWNNQGST